MTRFGRFVRNLVERFLGRYYEGPNPPRHISEEVRLFRILHPTATPEQWETFANLMAEKCYRSGFVRGYEWVERDWPGPAQDPEVLAEAMSHDWSLAESEPRFDRLLEGVSNPFDPLGEATAEERTQLLMQLGMLGGSYRSAPDEED